MPWLVRYWSITWARAWAQARLGELVSLASLLSLLPLLPAFLSWPPWSSRLSSSDPRRSRVSRSSSRSSSSSLPPRLLAAQLARTRMRGARAEMGWASIRVLTPALKVKLSWASVKLGPLTPPTVALNTAT